MKKLLIGALAILGCWVAYALLARLFTPDDSIFPGVIFVFLLLGAFLLWLIAALSLFIRWVLAPSRED
ncbi:MAG: hypothetical protein WD181_01840 [Solirubrobacterales bacterium]